MKESKNDFDWHRISLYLKLGIIGATIILLGDMLMGWGVRDTTLPCIEAQLSPYLSISDRKMLWAAIFGFSGVPLAVIGHYGIYKLLKPYSSTYAHLYGLGNLGFLAFGGSGVHVVSVTAAYFYKYMTNANASNTLDSTMRFAIYFLVPLYAVLLTGWVIMVIAHIIAVAKGLSPLPRWSWVFSMPVGTILFSLIGISGNYSLVNALMVGAFSLGNIWCLSGHLCLLEKARENV